MALGDQAGVEAVKRLEIDIPNWVALIKRTVEEIKEGMEIEIVIKFKKNAPTS